ncbi:MAG: 2-hydroxyacyl-CoA dehydratase [Planctomycetes bacterium]|nr:2-hydroxyacyl-CoA dehydratase [Planctomycetota bacterium]
MTAVRVAYSCSYVPPEWISAYGLRPERLTVDCSAEAAAKDCAGLARLQGLCPYARAFAASVIAQQADAVIFTTLCDQMRRICELLPAEWAAKTFLLNVPRTWQSAGAFRFYKEELVRLGGFLETFGGRAPSSDDLAALMSAADNDRQECRTLAAESFSQADRSLKRLALTGGPITTDDSWLPGVVRQHSGLVVLDATETGDLGQPGPFDHRRLADDPFDELANAYFSIPHPARRPNDPFYAWLGENLAARQIQGIIIRRFTWCDTWAIEKNRMRERFSMPVVEVEACGGSGARARTHSRVQALMEAIH